MEPTAWNTSGKRSRSDEEEVEEVEEEDAPAGRRAGGRRLLPARRRGATSPPPPPRCGGGGVRDRARPALMNWRVWRAWRRSPLTTRRGLQLGRAHLEPLRRTHLLQGLEEEGPPWGSMISAMSADALPPERPPPAPPPAAPPAAAGAAEPFELLDEPVRRVARVAIAREDERQREARARQGAPYELHLRLTHIVRGAATAHVGGGGELVEDDETAARARRRARSRRPALTR